jgi:formate dehydrogenase major subunit
VNVTRRDFLKLSGATTGFMLTSSVFGWVKIPEALADIGPKVGTETTSICCFCACGCGVLATTKNFGTPNAKLLNVEGDPTHPVNEGALCTKAVSTRDTVRRVVPNGKLVSTYFEGALIDEWDPAKYDSGTGKMAIANNRRVSRVLWRPANGTQWQVKSWDFALKRIAWHYAATRDFPGMFEDHDGTMTVNRLNTVACLGGAAHDNQECYLLRKLMTGLGVYYVEHQARI